MLYLKLQQSIHLEMALKQPLVVKHLWLKVSLLFKAAMRNVGCHIGLFLGHLDECFACFSSKDFLVYFEC